MAGEYVMLRDGNERIGRRMAGLAALSSALILLAASSARAQMIPSGPEPAPQAQGPSTGPAAKGPSRGQPGSSGEAAKKDPAAALKLLEAGVKSYEIGKLDPAVQQLTSALASGLPSQQMARALYYRGLAFRKQSKPAQAISDLTSAIWLKGGLADAERANAVESRAAAYREAGLGDPAPVVAETSRAAAAPAASTTAAAPASGWQTATAASGGSTEPKLSAAPAEAPPAGGSGGLGGFFSGLFGGSTSSSAAPAPSTTASTAVAAPPTATSSWGDATSVASAKGRTTPPAAAGNPAPSVKVAAAAPAAAAPAAPVFKGKFRLQVAAVRSRAEAEALAQKLKQAHGSAIGGREPAIEQSVIGAMGTFYRVRVGPYADANEPRQLCSRIKPDGFDCLVVTQ